MRCRNYTNDNKIAFLGSFGLLQPTIINITDGTSTLQVNVDEANEDIQYEVWQDFTNIYISCNKSKTNRLSLTSSDNPITITYTFIDGRTIQRKYDCTEPTDINEVWPCFSITAINYVEEADAITSALRQKLSVIKGELWFNRSFGIPLIDKVKSKAIFDTYTMSIVNKQTGINNIKKFESTVERHDYHLNIELQSVYGDVRIDL